MGKGDIKTKKGKITNHSFGKRRLHDVTVKKKDVPEVAEPVKKK
ncbi:MAG: 30S ribosomal protein THX [Flavobacterium sp.]|nr:30S ribosomal protein THX [Pedobacter sp.]